ncbi:MAG: amidohydrolase family protein [Actinomycetota bacterium]
MSRLSIRASLAWLGPGRILEDAQVVCEGGVISHAGEPVPGGTDDAFFVDGFLMPAVADRHVHIGLSDPGAVLRGGVTAVRDLAWPSERIFPLADLSEAPSFDGPLIRAAGPMLTAPGGYPTGAAWAPVGTGREVDDPQAAVIAVAEMAAAGATAIKVSLNAEAGPTLGDAELMAVCDAAHAADLPVTAHAQGKDQVERALGAGIDELAHTPWVWLSDDVIQRCARTLRIVSTLDILGFGRSTPELRIALDNLRRFHRAGGEVIYGTDLGNGSVPPGIDPREIVLLAEAGLDPEAILLAATRAPLHAGAPADLIALASDPLADLDAFEHVVMVVRAGRIVAG